MYAPDKPSVVLSSRGLAACQVNLRTASTDMHSGGYGSTIANAVQQIARLAATFHTDDGRVAVAGFYDKVKDVTPEEREQIATVPFDEKEYLQRVGAERLWGEPGYSPLERNWKRPTLDINGIWGGFQGEGTKTVTPSEAHMKITCRLVPDQDPAEILDLIERHVAKHTSPNATATVQRFPGSAHPFSLSPDNPALLTARKVLAELYGTEPISIRQGGTLPVADVFQRELGADLIFFSFGMPDSRVHAPNEAFRMDSFRMAPRAFCAYLNALAR
jgi:acetylornithine deacetylase/succinyl-diaminopimelate desuccinylase-like protein